MQHSAGIVCYKNTDKGLEVLLIHPGGPYFWNKEQEVWGIPKGGINPDEDIKSAAIREFTEETSLHIDTDKLQYLGKFKQSTAKQLEIFIIEITEDLDLSNFQSNTFEMEWPKDSGEINEYPEADRIGWFNVKDIYEFMIKGQIKVIEAIMKRNDL